VVTPTFFETLTGNVLLDPGPANLNNLTLTIAFSSLQSAISMDFATNSGSGVPFDLLAYDGGTLVGSTSASGSIPVGFFFPEGVLSFSGANFDKVVLSAPSALDFAIDNVTVSPSVPEPAAPSVSAFVIGAVVFVRQRRLRQS
jgi:hypothetical protein